MPFLDVSEAEFLPSSGVKGTDLMQLSSTKGVSLRTKELVSRQKELVSGQKELVSRQKS
jgi:hypothetical protein